MAPQAIIIEDDPKQGEIYQTVVEQAGFDVYLDSTGKEYLGYLANIAPALVVVDLHLPYTTGGQVVDHVRAQHPDAVIAVVTADILSAKSIMTRVDHVLIKPISVAKLLNLAESVKDNL